MKIPHFETDINDEYHFEEIDTYKNEIDNAQFALTTLMKEYDDYKIIANFDGVVTKLDMQI